MDATEEAPKKLSLMRSFRKLLTNTRKGSDSSLYRRGSLDSNHRFSLSDGINRTVANLDDVSGGPQIQTDADTVQSVLMKASEQLQQLPSSPKENKKHQNKFLRGLSWKHRKKKQKGSLTCGTEPITAQSSNLVTPLGSTIHVGVGKTQSTPGSMLNITAHLHIVNNNNNHLLALDANKETSSSNGEQSAMLPGRKINSVNLSAYETGEVGQFITPDFSLEPRIIPNHSDEVDRPRMKRTLQSCSALLQSPTDHQVKSQSCSPGNQPTPLLGSCGRAQLPTPFTDSGSVAGELGEMDSGPVAGELGEMSPPRCNSPATLSVLPVALCGASIITETLQTCSSLPSNDPPGLGASPIQTAEREVSDTRVSSATASRRPIPRRRTLIITSPGLLVQNLNTSRGDLCNQTAPSETLYFPSNAETSLVSCRPTRGNDGLASTLPEPLSLSNSHEATVLDNTSCCDDSRVCNSSKLLLAHVRPPLRQVPVHPTQIRTNPNARCSTPTSFNKATPIFTMEMEGQDHEGDNDEVFQRNVMLSVSKPNCVDRTESNSNVFPQGLAMSRSENEQRDNCSPLSSCSPIAPTVSLSQHDNLTLQYSPFKFGPKTCSSYKVVASMPECRLIVDSDYDQGGKQQGKGDGLNDIHRQTTSEKIPVSLVKIPLNTNCWAYSELDQLKIIEQITRNDEISSSDVFMNDATNAACKEFWGKRRCNEDTNSSSSDSVKTFPEITFNNRRNNLFMIDLLDNGWESSQSFLFSSPKRIGKRMSSDSSQVVTDDSNSQNVSHLSGWDHNGVTLLNGRTKVPDACTNSLLHHSCSTTVDSMSLTTSATLASPVIVAPATKFSDACISGTLYNNCPTTAPPEASAKTASAKCVTASDPQGRASPAMVGDGAPTRPHAVTVAAASADAAGAATSAADRTPVTSVCGRGDAVQSTLTNTDTSVVRPSADSVGSPLNGAAWATTCVASTLVTNGGVESNEEDVAGVRRSICDDIGGFTSASAQVLGATVGGVSTAAGSEGVSTNDICLGKACDNSPALLRAGFGAVSAESRLKSAIPIGSITKKADINRPDACHANLHPQKLAGVGKKTVELKETCSDTRKVSSRFGYKKKVKSLLKPASAIILENNTVPVLCSAKQIQSTHLGRNSSIPSSTSTKESLLFPKRKKLALNSKSAKISVAFDKFCHKTSYLKPFRAAMPTQSIEVERENTEVAGKILGISNALGSVETTENDSTPCDEFSDVSESEIKIELLGTVDFCSYAGYAGSIDITQLNSNDMPTNMPIVPDNVSDTSFSPAPPDLILSLDSDIMTLISCKDERHIGLDTRSGDTDVRLLECDPRIRNTSVEYGDSSDSGKWSPTVSEESTDLACEMMPSLEDPTPEPLCSGERIIYATRENTPVADDDGSPVSEDDNSDVPEEVDFEKLETEIRSKVDDMKKLDELLLSPGDDDSADMTDDIIDLTGEVCFLPDDISPTPELALSCGLTVEKVSDCHKETIESAAEISGKSLVLNIQGEVSLLSENDHTFSDGLTNMNKDLPNLLNLEDGIQSNPTPCSDQLQHRLASERDPFAMGKESLKPRVPTQRGRRPIKGSDGSPGAADKDKVCGGILTPPREERSAPEGTSSPTPRPSEAGDKGAQAPPPGYLSQAQVDALLKRQEAQFEERLQRVSHSTDQKEKELHSRMKEEQKELAELRSVVVEVTQSREALLKMLEQYKDMLAAVVKGKSTLDKGQEQRMKDLEAQKNQALEDLANVEAAFSDVHRKYERTKQIVETMRRNEETLQGAVADYENKVKRQEATLITFQHHAEEKMQQAGDEYDKLKQNTDQELTKMGALLKKAEMKIISLQDQLDRKSRDNQELTQLLDDLIAKMGPST